MVDAPHTGRQAPWADLGPWVEARLGLHFPPRLWPDLQRGMEAAARQLRLPDGEACAQRALAGALGPEELHVIAECLAIGETYFFRDPALFERLAAQVLAPLIEARRRGSRHLRLWSAGCSSGEEAYSLAMLVAGLLPDWREWNLFILGTDLNAAALRKAHAGAYGHWSLRGPLPPQCGAWLHEGSDGRHHVDAELRRRVRFEQLNLAGSGYPSAATFTEGMDLVLCRNVLIYFEPTPPVRCTRVGQRAGAQAAGAPARWRCPPCRYPGLAGVHADGLYALRRVAATPPPVRSPRLPPCRAHPRSRRRSRARAWPRARSRPPPPTSGRAVAALLRQARERADGATSRRRAPGRQPWRATSSIRSAPGCSAPLAERGATQEAMASLQRTLYLEPDHLLARFSLGSLALRQGRREAGRRHLQRALAGLGTLSPDEVVAGSGGLTARELEQAIRRAEEAR